MAASSKLNTLASYVWLTGSGSAGFCVVLKVTVCFCAVVTVSGAEVSSPPFAPQAGSKRADKAKINTNIFDQFLKTINNPEILEEKNQKIEKTMKDFNEIVKTEMTNTFYKNKAIDSTRKEEILTTFYKSDIDNRLMESNKLNDLIKDRKDSEVCSYVSDNADVPTIFEYILGIVWYRISNKEGNILKFMNLSLDADLLPKTHAGGGMADIVYEYKENNYPKHNLLIEATLSESTGQRHMEMEPVSRHLGEDISSTNNENDYALFVAPNLEERLILDFRNMRSRFYPKADGSYIEGLKIIPIDTDILKKFITDHKKYSDIYSLFDNAYKSQTPDPEWFKKEILQKI